MQAYNIFFKKQGSIKLSFRRFEIDRGRIVLYDAHNEPASQHAFLSLEHVGALIPEIQDEDPPGFTVRLVNGESFRICGEFFLIEESNLTFYREQNFRNLPLKNIYVALDVVAAITPDRGLQRE
jgi:hypothetical protein